MTIDVQRFISFCPVAGPGGNTANVAIASLHRESELRSLAKTLGSELTVIDEASLTGETMGVRFFFGGGEMLFCGHGMLGAAYYVNRATGRSRFGFTLRDRVVRLRVRRGVSDEMEVRFETELPVPQRIDEAAAAPCLNALGLDRADLSGHPIVLAGSPRPKVLVPVLSESVLDAIRTTEARVAAACAPIGATGLYPFVQLSDRAYSARQFPVDAGFLEDPATGNAAVALASAVAAGLIPGARVGDMQITQGKAMGKPSLLRVCFLENRSVAVGGTVREAARTAMES